MSFKQPLGIAILFSSRGSNMSKIVENVRSGALDCVDVRCIVTDNEQAPGLKVAEENDLESYLIPFEREKYRYSLGEAGERALSAYLKEKDVQLIVLAGFMRILKHCLLEDFRGRIINIHPSLLPKYKGLDTHKRALEGGEKESGCTVHLVSDGVDEGTILGQRIVPIIPGDTADTLAYRVLQEEHQLYSQIIDAISKGHFPLPLI